MNVDRDTLVAYVLGGLSSGEEDEVAQHLRAHPEEAAWVKDSFEALAAFALSGPPEALPEDAEATLLARIRGASVRPAGAEEEDAEAQQDAVEAEEYVGEYVREPTGEKIAAGAGDASPWSVRTFWLGLATAAAVVILVWLSVLEPRQDAQAELEALCAGPNNVCQTLTNAQNEPIGTVARRADNSVLVVFDAEPPSENVYQAWEIVGDVPRSLGTFGNRVVDVTAPLSAGSTFGVTLEPPGGSPQPTSTPIVLYPLPG